MKHVILLTDISNPRGFGRAAGAYRMATELESIGYEVDVIDFILSFSIEELLSLIKNKIRKNTEWLGFSSTFLHASFDVFSTGNSKKVKVITGGSSISYQPDDAQFLINQIRKMGLRVIIGGQILNMILKM